MELLRQYAWYFRQQRVAHVVSGHQVAELFWGV